jgi:hypothetical protein
MTPTEEKPMQYLVEMNLADSGRSATPEAGLAFIEQYVLPSMTMGAALLEAGKIRAGGPISGTIGMAMIVEAGSAQELDELIENIPIWPRMEVRIVPLTTFEGRARAVQPRLQRLKERLAGAAR